jgi:hypothetical protein
MFCINNVNSTILIERLGYGNFKCNNGSVFTVESNRVKSGHIHLKEIFNKKNMKSLIESLFLVVTLFEIDP